MSPADMATFVEVGGPSGISPADRAALDQQQPRRSSRLMRPPPSAAYQKELDAIRNRQQKELNEIRTRQQFPRFWMQRARAKGPPHPRGQTFTDLGHMGNPADDAHWQASNEAFNVFRGGDNFYLRDLPLVPLLGDTTEPKPTRTIASSSSESSGTGKKRQKKQNAPHRQPSGKRAYTSTYRRQMELRGDRPSQFTDSLFREACDALPAHWPRILYDVPVSIPSHPPRPKPQTSSDSDTSKKSTKTSRKSKK